MPDFARTRAACVAAFLVTAMPASFAMNWEGHDDWFLNAEPFASFTELLPPPLPSPLPTCAERRNASAQNIYEQAAVPGLNCIEEKVRDSRPAE